MQTQPDTETNYWALGKIYYMFVFSSNCCCFALIFFFLSLALPQSWTVEQWGQIVDAVFSCCGCCCWRFCWWTTCLTLWRKPCVHLGAVCSACSPQDHKGKIGQDETGTNAAAATCSVQHIKCFCPMMLVFMSSHTQLHLLWNNKYRSFCSLVLISLKPL